MKFSGLKPDGLVLKRMELGGVPVLLAGGNDETGTMYAAYELLERLGIVFQLTNDIIPQRKPNLAIPRTRRAHGAALSAAGCTVGKGFAGTWVWRSFARKSTN